MGKISNYASALKAKLTDYFVIASNNNGVLETKKVTTEQIGDAVASDQVHSSLDTSDKTLIGGINEVNSNVGTLSTLTTTDKSSLVGAVNEVNSGKADKTQLATTAFTNITPVTGVSIKVNKSHYITDKVVHLFVVFQTTVNITNSKLCDISANDCAGVSFPIFCSDSQWGAYNTICYGYMSSTSITATVTTAKPYLCIDTIIALS